MKQKTKKQKIKQPEKSTKQQSPQPSTSKEVSPPGSASSSSTEEELEVEKLDALPPKEKLPTLLNPVVDGIPALRQFHQFLVSMDGGSRPNLASLENVRRVGRLLYQVQTIPRDVTLLWNDEAVHVIRKRFFENNHLAEKPRTATTLRAYVTALRLFYNFVQA